MGNSSTNVGVTRMALSEALALGPDTWDGLLGHAKSPSPFMSWAWHRAWADCAPPAEVNASEVFAVHASGNSPGVHGLWLQALALGYRVAIRPSRREPFTGHRLISALRQAGHEL